MQEYLPGGDLRNLLDNLGRLSEDHARLYIAEVVLAVEALHMLGYIHRHDTASKPSFVMHVAHWACLSAEI